MADRRSARDGVPRHRASLGGPPRRRVLRRARRRSSPVSSARSGCFTTSASGLGLLSAYALPLFVLLVMLGVERTVPLGKNYGPSGPRSLERFDSVGAASETASMRIGYSDDSEALRQTLRSYYDKLLDPRGPRAAVAFRRHRPRHAGRRAARWASDGWLGIGWPRRVRRPGPHADRAVRLLRRVDAGAGAGADADHQHRRPDDHAFRHRRAEAVLPAEDPRGRDPLLHRILRARRRHRSGGAADPSGARRRRVHHQRPEDLDEPGVRCRLLLAGGAHEPRGQEAQGHLDDHRRHEEHARGSPCARSTCCRDTTCARCSSTTCACPSPTSSARRTAAGTSSPTSSTTSGSRCARRA